jgi:1-acyl-sn-glycerol-3-phosphate acyltransferase
LEVIGLENLPPKGGYIIAANHLSVIEVPLVYCVIKRQDITGLVAKKHQKNFFFRWLVDTAGGIWLNREEADTQALRNASTHLQNGGILGISPEGTRSQTGGLIPAKTGVAYLADRVQVPLIPVAITGTWKAFRKIILLRRPRITVRFGKPFTLPPLDRQDRAKSLRNNTDEIMSRIATLLPPEYRGVYANHPRVHELLQIEGGS